MGEPSPPQRKNKWRRLKLPRETGRDNELRGPSDFLKRLEDTYAYILKDKKVEKDLKDVFQTLRIAVFGRSGSGKTTIIRLVVGDDGPQTISEGTAGKQDINQEWRSSDPELPIIIHDSNGMDIKGQERVDTIKNFLHKHQNSGEFSQRIHIVWYVISAADRRFLDDGDVMKLVISYGIPLLLVMTHNDWKDAVAQNVTDSNLDKLLSGVRDKENVKRRMVRLGNKVDVVDNKLIGVRDLKALKLLSKRTKEHLGKELRWTWAASQAVDIDQKVDASARLIMRYKKAAVYSSVVGAIPLVDQIKLTYMFVMILKNLCKIWRVPPNLEKVLYKNVFMKEGVKSLFRDLLKNMLGAAALVLSVAATVVTDGAASPLVSASLELSSVPGIMNYSLLLLGSILYVKAIKIDRDNKWDPDQSEEDYTRFCDDFGKSNYAQKLTNFAQQSHSARDTTWLTKKEKGEIKNLVVHFFEDLLLERPTSLRTLMQSDNPEPDATQVPAEVKDFAAKLFWRVGEDLGEGENSASQESSSSDDDDGGWKNDDTEEIK